MYKIIICLGLVLFLTSAVLGQEKGTTFPEAKKSGKANLQCVFVETPRFASKNGSSADGLTVAIMKGFAEYVEKQEGIQVNLSFQDRYSSNFSTFLNAVGQSQGGVFGLGNVTITEERKKNFHFSHPFITNVAVILTQKEAPTLASMNKIGDSFKGMKAIAVKGTTNEKRILMIKKKHFPDLEIVYANSSPEALEKLLQSPNSFTNLDFTYYLDALQSGKNIKRHPAGDESSEDFGIIMPKSNDWVTLLNRYMEEELINSSAYRQMIADNLGSNALRLLDSIAKK